MKALAEAEARGHSQQLWGLRLEVGIQAAVCSMISLPPCLQSMKHILLPLTSEAACERGAQVTLLEGQEVAVGSVTSYTATPMGEHHALAFVNVKADPKEGLSLPEEIHNCLI